jgi:UDP-N-acetylmuramoyl-L-alanyl-D-glutamate--2,6-diaminopimelate ligase
LETKKSGINIEKITDRKEAIKKAVSLARKRDAVVLTGKGGEVWMCVENGKKIPWDEKGIVEKYLSFPRKRESSQ